MRLVFAGTPDVALPSLQRLLDSARHEVVAVVTRPPAPAGRGRALQTSPVHELALAAGVEVLTPIKPGDPGFLARLTELQPDCAPVVAYGAILPAETLSVPRLGWVNLHFSLLPAWRGAAPVQRAILAGDEVTGATTFLLEQGMDTGPVLGVLTEEIRPTDTSGSLLTRLAAVGAVLLERTLDGIAEGEVGAVPQPTEGVSLAPKLTADEVRVDWSAPALRVNRVTRAADPNPGAWTTWRHGRIKLSPVAIPSAGPQERTDLDPGEVRVSSRTVLVGTGSGTVELVQVKPEGRGWLPAADWANGARPTARECFS